MACLYMIIVLKVIYLVARTPPGTSSGAPARTSTWATFPVSSWTPIVPHKDTEKNVF